MLDVQILNYVETFTGAMEDWFLERLRECDSEAKTRQRALEMEKAGLADLDDQREPPESTKTSVRRWLTAPVHKGLSVYIQTLLL